VSPFSRPEARRTGAVVATLTEAFTSKPERAASTYPFVAAWASSVGAATLILPEPSLITNLLAVASDVASSSFALSVDDITPAVEDVARFGVRVTRPPDSFTVKAVEAEPAAEIPARNVRQTPLAYIRSVSDVVL